MIKEDYVSFETAKLLKEKGFDAEGVSEFGGFYVDYYHTGKRVGLATESMMLNKTLEGWEYLRPTLQMAMKWLREEWHIFIRVIQSHIEHCVCEIYYNSSSCYTFRTSFDSYEEACEEAIKYTLKKLI